MTSLQYPIGQFTLPQEITDSQITNWINSIRSLLEQLMTVTQNFTPELWQTPYRPDGWTARQVVHHIADSHMNAMLRFKWALTEEAPVIKPYNEKLWAQLPDVVLTPTEVSLQLIRFLHQRWVVLLEALQPQDLMKTYSHPETKKVYNLKTAIGLYAWHGQHHLAHLKLIAGA